MKDGRVAEPRAGAQLQDCPMSRSLSEDYLEVSCFGEVFRGCDEEEDVFGLGGLGFDDSQGAEVMSAERRSH